MVFPGICLTTGEISRESVCQGNRKALGWSAPNAFWLFDLAIADVGFDCLQAPAALGFHRQAKGSTLGQRKYLPNFRTRGFPTSANFESKIAVWTMMWSANSGIHRSSRICQLRTYQAAPVARRRQLDCKTCRLRTWVLAADLHEMKTVAPNAVCIGKSMLAVISSLQCCQSMWLFKWLDGGPSGSQSSKRETLRDRKNSNRWDSETVKYRMIIVAGRKENIWLKNR